MGAVATTGTWGGIPDVGFTEWLTGGAGGSTFNNPNRATGLTNYTQDTAFQVPQVGQPTTTLDVNRAINSGGAVLGASTQNTGGNTITQQQMQSNYSFGDPNNPDLSNPVKQTDWENYQRTNKQSSGPSYEDQMRGQIDSGYNNYFSELDNMLGGLDTQKQSQENIANIQSNQQISDLGASTQQNIGKLEEEKTKVMDNQVKTLKDISGNIRNLLQAGNTYLGSRGAGDSSAVNQYGYATTKLGSQQRGDVMGQTRQILSTIGSKIADVNNIFTQEKNRIQSELGVKVQEIASWFADAQNQLRQAKAQGQLNKSADLQALTTNLYNQAVQQLTNIQNQTAKRQSQLETWALNNSKSLAEAKANLSGIAQYSAPTQAYSAISGTPRFDQQGNMGVDFRGGVGTGFGLTDDQKDMLGIPR